MRHRRGLAAIAAIGLLGTLAACSSSASSSPAGSAAIGKTITNVTFGYSNANLDNWASARLAYDPGYCAPYGVRVTPQVLSATSYVPAVNADEVNFAFSAGSLLTALTKGIIHNAKAIAYLGLNQPDGVVGIWAGPKITSTSQLAGKTLGAQNAVGPTHLAAVDILKNAGISDSQVQFTYIANNAAVQAALAHGTIAAAWNNGPLPAANIAAGDHLVLPLTSDHPLQAIDSFYMVGNTSFMAAHPAATKGVLECLAAATKAGRSTDPAVLAKFQSVLAQQVGNLKLASEAWPEYTISAAVLPMTAANIATLQQSMSLQLSKAVPMSTITGIVDTTAMQGVTGVPVVNYDGTSPFPAYSGK